MFCRLIAMDPKTAELESWATYDFQDPSDALAWASGVCERTGFSPIMVYADWGTNRLSPDWPEGFEACTKEWYEEMMKRVLSLDRFEVLFPSNQAKAAIKPHKAPPQLPPEIWNTKPFNAQVAWEATKALSMGGGGNKGEMK